MRVFEELDKSLIDMEAWQPKMSQTPNVWPSEASATLLDKTESDGVGGCRRASYYRMTGQPVTNPMDAVGSQVVRIGKAVERDVFEQAVEAGLCAATGVRVWVEDVSLPFELDGVLVDKDTKQGVIAEVKSFDGYYATKQIVREGKPKLEHVLQIIVYINELRNGANLRVAIDKCVEEAWNDPEGAARHRNRIKVYPEQLGAMGSGELAGKLLYVDRAGRNKREFDIGIFTDTDGLHYPTVDGTPWKVFTIESIYDRYSQLQEQWKVAVSEARRLLAAKGIQPPILTLGANGEMDEASRKASTEYWDKIREEIAELPDSFLPAADYQYKYSAEKIEALRKADLITDKKYKAWKSKHAIIGAWQCRYCRYKNTCVAKEYPELRYLLLNVNLGEEEMENG